MHMVFEKASIESFYGEINEKFVTSNKWSKLGNFNGFHLRELILI